MRNSSKSYTSCVANDLPPFAAVRHAAVLGDARRSCERWRDLKTYEQHCPQDFQNELLIIKVDQNDTQMTCESGPVTGGPVRTPLCICAMPIPEHYPKTCVTGINLERANWKNIFLTRLENMQKHPLGFVFRLVFDELWMLYFLWMFWICSNVF